MDTPNTPQIQQKRSWKSNMRVLLSKKISKPFVLTSIVITGVAIGVLVSFFTSFESKKPAGKDTIEDSYVIPTLSYFELKTLDNEPLEYSRSMELSGEVGSGVLAIEIWSSCDDDTHRLKSFKKNNVAFTYKIANNLGNLCRGSNEYSVRAIGKDGKGEKIMETKSRLQMSQVGIRRRSDLPVIRFMQEHTLPAERSIEDSATLPTRLFPSPQFLEACAKRDVFSAEEDALMKVNDEVAAKLSIEQEKMYAGSSATLKVARMYWFTKQGNVFIPSAVPPLEWSSCSAIPGIHVNAPSTSKFVVNQLNGEPEQYFDGGIWTSIRTLLLRTVPIDAGDLGSVRAVVKDNTLAIIEENENRDRYYEEPRLMGDMRGEYLFNLDDNRFMGVVWHRRR